MKQFSGCTHATQVNEECEINAALVKMEDESISRTAQENAMEVVAQSLGKMVRQGMELPQPILNCDNLCGRSAECPYYSPPWRSKEH